MISVQQDYKPSVNTWGVFDRPANISEAYGGGRTLKPSDSVMSDEEQSAYDARLQAKLAAYRNASGLNADPVTVQACKDLTAKGTRLCACLQLFTRLHVRASGYRARVSDSDAE